MNLLRALIWKEGREASYKIAIGVCLGLFVGLIPKDALDFPALLVGLFGAVLMGMDAVAGERSRGTLPFLFIRPLDRGWLLGAKFVVGAVGLLAVLAAYWAGVYHGLSEWGNPQFLWGFLWEPGTSLSLYEEVILADVGYGRILLLWFFLFLNLYTAVFLASMIADRTLKAAVGGVIIAWVAFSFLGFTMFLLPEDVVWYYLSEVFMPGLGRDVAILRHAFDPMLILVKIATAVLLAAGAILWARWGLSVQGSRWFQWIAGLLVLIYAVVIGPVAFSHNSQEPVEPVGHLPYEVPVVDLALQDRSAVVLLERGVSVVDVADWRAPRESGRAEIEGWRLWRLALSGSTAYIWGSAEAQDSVGVAVFDLSRPDHPQLRAQRFLYPIEAGSTRWLEHTPRLVGWAAWDGYLYAGLLGNESLELHSFDVREGGLPQPVHVLPIAERAKHVWNNNWEMRLVGPHAFLTLGHDFVVLDLTDPRRPEELSRTPLRRFGPSKRYEESIEKLHHQLAPGVLPDSVALQLRVKKSSRGLDELGMRRYGTYGEYSYRIVVPPGLGPISLSGDKAYVQRHWPQELAVLDIGDLRRPVEVDYVAREYFSGGLTFLGDIAYSRKRSKIEARSVTGYGALAWLAELDLVEKKGNSRIYKPYDPAPYLASQSNNLILAGDHICAILKNNLVVFEALQDD